MILGGHVHGFAVSPRIIQVHFNQSDHVALRAALQHTDFVSNGKQSQIRGRQSRSPLSGLPAKLQCEPGQSEQIATGRQYIGSGSPLADEYLCAVGRQRSQGTAQAAEPPCFLIQPFAETTGDDSDATPAGT